MPISRGLSEVVRQVFRAGFGLDTVSLAGPCAQVDGLATFAAKRAVWVVGAVRVHEAARGATHRQGLGGGVRVGCRFGSRVGGRGLGHGCQAHKVSSKPASVSAAIFSFPSASGRIKRMDTSRRLALISGIRPREGSMRRRSNW